MNQKIGAVALIVFAGIAMAGEYVLDQPALRTQAAVAALDKTQIPLARAVVLAEQHVNGRAADVALESERGTVVAEVMVLTADRKLFEVKVNAIDGTIASSKLRHAQDDE